MDYAIHIDVNVSKTTVYFSSGPDGTRWTIRIEGQTPRFECDIMDAKGDKLPREWHITIHDDSQSNEHVRSRGGIGNAMYLNALDDIDYGHDACFEAWVVTAKDDLTKLVSAINAGREIQLIQLHVFDLKFGIAPDGSEVIWDMSDNATSRVVKDFGLRYLTQGAQDTDAETDFGVVPAPVDRPDYGSALLRAVTSLANPLHWAVGLLALIAGTLLWK